MPGMSPSTTADPALTWVEHLRRGGSEPWTTWRDRAADRAADLAAPAATPAGPAGPVPGAQQLELLRRLNAAGTPSVDLAERVLGASAPGRGLPDLGLAGAGAPRPFGPRPVDPADLPLDELVRVASGVLADEVVAAGVPEPERVPRARPWRTRYRLVGDPVLAASGRADLVRLGRPEGGRRPVILVLGTDLGQMIVDAWTARSLGSGAPGWRDWLTPVARDRGLPPRIDLPAVADTWAERVGPGRVQVVLDPDRIPRLLRVRRPLTTVPALSADAVELARRVGQVVGVLAVPERRQALLRETLRPRLAAHPGPPLTLPPALADVVRQRAERMRAALTASRYPVHGDPKALLPVPRDGVAEPTDAGVLALAMRLLLEKGSR